MKLDSGGTTEFLAFPLEETEKVIEAMEQAEQAEDIEALKWCARRFVWLGEIAEIEDGDDRSYPASVFNKAWAETVKNDPPPESITGIFTRLERTEGVKFDEPPRIGHRSDALALLDSVIEAGEVEGIGFVLSALRDALEREIV